MLLKSIFRRRVAWAILFFFCCNIQSGWGQTLNDDWINEVKWRSIGPANMGGRITAIAVNPKDTTTWWAASASGGLAKTENNGIDFEHQFHDQATVSIGDVQVSASDPNIVWVGTGEANPRNSVSYGDGVYKSVDGGKTWKNMGLKKTFQTGRISIHPTNPDIVYVGSLGRLWGPNEDRGLFKTEDGGATWEKVLYIDDKTGVIDVKMNPKNPDELIIATYERLRDNTDGNDPIKRYGDGSGIYRTRDAGKTFERLTQGLPTCKLGRIGLDYYAKNPSYIYAIVESEKIAQEPENAGFVGVRTEQADVGSRITSVTRNSPAEAAGLKEGDIVLEVDGKLVPTFELLDNEMRRRMAGEKMKLLISRNREIETLEVTLSKANEGNRRRQSPFNGTLGGQIENRQDQQGSEGYQYGGIYMSKDGGDSWTRINSLNPRPMYYSQIRVDPSNNKNIYVLGTSLYRSFDGGNVFKGDGGSDGIHVDHHAMWIDPANPKHMILGNDGGIHVTYDQMANWDHLNHVVFSQFYHVGVDTTPNYKVYGGLQDNGSWGGPNRSGHDSGTVNTDWFSVGGGDGFITLVDPTDPDQIYWESQNGGMGRINLRTGQRGFIRPQPPRGTSYRFNWKTPFILSPHNPDIFYAGGNYVFRSVSKGDRIEAISQEITNSDKGMASAITESPMRQGVLYVGTTCGAVWMTRDGGKEWEPIFFQKEEAAPDSADETDQQDAEATEGDTKSDDAASAAGETSAEGARPGRRGGRGRGQGGRAEGGRAEGGRAESGRAEAAAERREATTPPATSEAAKEAAAEAKESAEKTDEPPLANDPVSGKWELQFGDDAPPFLQGVSIDLKLADGKTVSGQVTTARGDAAIENGVFNAESGEVKFEVSNPRGMIEYSATIKDGKMTGEFSANDGQFSMEFQGTRIDKALSLSHENVSTHSLSLAGALSSVLFQDPVVQDPEVTTKSDDAVSGVWNCIIENDEVPNGRLEFQLDIKLEKENAVTGKAVSPMGEQEIIEGFYNAESKQLNITTQADDFTADFEGKVDGNKLSGTVSINDGMMKVEFVGEKVKAEVPADSQEEKKEEAKSEMADAPPESAPKTEADSEKTEKPAAETPAAEEVKAAKEDPISGTWSGTMNNERMPRGMNEFTLELKLDDKGVISGLFVTSRGENEIAGGKYDAEKKTAQFSSDNGRMEMTFDATVDSGKMSGTLSFGEQFSSDFEAERKGEAKAGTDAEAKKGASDNKPKPLAELLPGPRWVSALEASRYSAGRCYVTLAGHRYNDDEPYLFVTEDYGKTWKSIRGNLPTSAGVTRVIREDIVNENVLYLGCEFSAWVSVDRGQNWTRFKGNLPTVAVHEFAQHPTSGELIAGTHGRGVWIADVTPLRQWTAANLDAKATLYRPNRLIQWRSEPRRGDTGPRRFVGENPSRDAHFYYSLKENARQVEFTVSNLKGDTLFRAEEPATSAGLHHIEWNLRVGGGPQGGGRGGRGGFGGVSPGSYLITLTVDGAIMTQEFEVLRDPDAPSDAAAPSLSEEEVEMIFGNIDD